MLEDYEWVFGYGSYDADGTLNSNIKADIKFDINGFIVNDKTVKYMAYSIALYDKTSSQYVTLRKENFNNANVSIYKKLNRLSTYSKILNNITQINNLKNKIEKENDINTLFSVTYRNGSAGNLSNAFSFTCIIDGIKHGDAFHTEFNKEVHAGYKHIFAYEEELDNGSRQPTLPIINPLVFRASTDECSEYTIQYENANRLYITIWEIREGLTNAPTAENNDFIALTLIDKAFLYVYYVNQQSIESRLVNVENQKDISAELETRNLYKSYNNIYDLSVDVFVGSLSNTDNSVLPENTNFRYTSYIPIFNANKYLVEIAGGYCNVLNYGCWNKVNCYDKDYNFISSHNYSMVKPNDDSDESTWPIKKVLLPAATAFIRLQANAAAYNRGVQTNCVFLLDEPIDTLGEIPQYEENKNVPASLVYDFIKNSKDGTTYQNDDVVDYIKTETDRVISLIKSKQNLHPKMCHLGFLTDLHFASDDTAIKNNIYALNKISKFINLPFTVFGGDNIAETNPRSAHLEKITRFNNILATLTTPYGLVKGNHDDASICGYNADASSTNHSKYLSGFNCFDYEYYELYRHNENIYNIFMDKYRDKLYYYVDLPSYQIRLICLNAVDIPYIDVVDETDGKTYLKYHGQHDYGYSNEQLNWVVNQALNFSNIPNGKDYGVITFQHMPEFSSSITTDIIKEAANGKVMYNIFKALQNKETYTFSRTNSDFNCDINCNFQNATQEVICRINGHNHADRSIIQDNILFISTMQAGINSVGNANADDGNTYTKTPASATESAFDIYSIDRDSRKIFTTRYGAGIDREFSY